MSRKTILGIIADDQGLSKLMPCLFEKVSKLSNFFNTNSIFHISILILSSVDYCLLETTQEITTAAAEECFFEVHGKGVMVPAVEFGLGLPA